ncbi:DUF2946 domain-containing protein [Marinobacter halodurans]|uniref:DUF2946 domain-containing protein n=1 Tax=Marinobacter halodurans TaxID=2528979 RepID=A0ABY1ZG64_9GAMM|nr:DUF2946 domain-containing protein [Marinobacter halodurans]TBW50570.1 DUF2946 domain-containing protein [Marinobacter halodurans]
MNPTASPASVMSFQGWRQRLGASLALWAMVLIFAAPLWSKSMALMHHDGMGPDRAGHADPHAMADVPMVPPATDGPITFDHPECGYCVLLAHVTPMSPPPLTIAVPVRWSLTADRWPVRTVATRQLRYALAEVRAPPTFTG